MADWKRPLIVGASGQVGSALSRELERTQPSGKVLRSSRQARAGWLRLDLAELAASSQAIVPVEEAEPDLILCVGGMTFVDGCEEAPEACSSANAVGPAILARYARRRQIPFVFFSSDYIFSGSASSPGPYVETDAPQPTSAYGESKWRGEQAVLGEHPGALIVRTTVVYGPDAQGKNFLYTLLRHLAAGQRLRVPRDQISTPTYNRDLAAATLGLVALGVSGIVHVAGPELMDRFQFAREVAGVFNLDDSVIEGIETASLAQRASRPLFSGLVTSKLESLLPSLARHTVREALRDSQRELREFLATVTGEGGSRTVA